MGIQPFVLSVLMTAVQKFVRSIANGANPPEADYWRNYGVEANILTRAYTNPANYTGAFDSNGWPELAKNASVQYDAFLSCDYMAHVPKPGRYVITVPGRMGVKLTVNGTQEYQVGAVIKSISPAGAVANSFNGNQIENASDTPMRIEFDMPATTTRNTVNGDGIRINATHFLRVSFMWLGATGTTRSVGDCRVFHIDAEADVNAGWKYTSEFINYITGSNPSAPVRVMPLFCPNTTYVETPADIPPPVKNSRIENASKLASSPLGSRGTGKLRSTSPEELAEIQFRTGRPLWVSLPPMMNDAALASFFQRLYDALTALHGGPTHTAQVYVEASNELWNGSFASNYGYLSEIYSTVYPGTGAPALEASKANAYVVYQMNGMHFALRAWKQAELVFGRSRIVRTLGCQVAFYDGGAKIMVNYVDPGIIAAGSKIGDIADIVTVAPYFNTYGDSQVTTRANVIAGTAVYQSLNLGQYLPPARGISTTATVGANNMMSVTERLRNKVYTNGMNGKTWPEWIDAAFRNGLSWNAITCRYFVGQLRADGFNSIRIGIYEINSHDDYGGSGISSADPFGLVCTYAGGVFTPVTADPNMLESGEIVKVLPIPGVSGSSVGGNFAAGVNFKAKVAANGTVTLHATQADYDAGTAATGTAANQVVLVNSTRLDAMHRAQVEWLWHTTAGAQFVRDVSAEMAAVGFDVACWFADGGYSYSFNSSKPAVQPWTFADKGLWNAGIGHSAWKAL